MKSSTSSGPQAHGNEPAYSLKRRNKASRAFTVASANSRDFCWRAQPDNIASKTAASSSRCTTPSTMASRADPGTSANSTFPCQPRGDIVAFTLPSSQRSWQ